MSSTPENVRYSRIRVAEHGMNFSVAHFTIFSATERENLHGHNYRVQCSLVAPIDDNGLTFDYRIFKRLIRELCGDLDEQMLLAGKSPYLEIVVEEDYTIAIFGNERIPFLHRDVSILPITNISVEELSHYLLQQALNAPELADRGIIEMTVEVSSDPRQSGASHWKHPDQPEEP